MIFATEREKCKGGCFASAPKLEINLDIDDFDKLKEIYQNYNFEEYETVEEEVSKIIRCIINFIEYNPEVVDLST